MHNAWGRSVLFILPLFDLPACNVPALGLEWHSLRLSRTVSQRFFRILNWPQPSALDMTWNERKIQIMHQSMKFFCRSRQSTAITGNTDRRIKASCTLGRKLIFPIFQIFARAHDAFSCKKTQLPQSYLPNMPFLDMHRCNYYRSFNGFAFIFIFMIFPTKAKFHTSIDNDRRIGMGLFTMRQYCLAILSLFVLFLNLPACHGERILIHSEFNKTTPLRIPPWAIKHLNRNKKYNISSLEKMPWIQDWHIDWLSLPEECRFYKTDSHIRIVTCKDVSILSKSGYSSSRKLQLKLNAEMPGNTRSESSNIAIGFLYSGMINSGWKHAKSIRMFPGNKISIDVPLGFSLCSGNFFCMMLKISGDVVLKDFKLLELPDDLMPDGITLLEGTIKDISTIPNPKKSDYPDCRFTAILEGENIMLGIACPQRIQLIIDGFKNYKLLGTSKLKTGDRVRCLVMPFEKLPDEKKTVQLADDINNFELQNYYVDEIIKIPSFSMPSSIAFSGVQKYISIFERKINPPISQKIINSQQLCIKESASYISKILAPYSETTKSRLNNRFKKAWEAEVAKDPIGFNRHSYYKTYYKTDNYVWRNINNSFWVLRKHHQLISKPNLLNHDNLDALLALQDFLNANGCQLIIAIIPHFYDISARVINAEFRNVPDFSSAYLIQQLLINNLEAIYISDKLLNEYNRYQFAFFYPGNSHPSDTTQDILTDVLAERLRRFSFSETMDKKNFTTVNVPHVYGNDKRYLFPENCDIGTNKANTPYCCRAVLYKGKPIPPDKQSPILVIGNSFMQTPMTYPDSVPTLLASKMCMGIDFWRGDGLAPLTTMVAQMFSHPEFYLKGKRVVILVLGLQHLSSAVRINNVRTMDIQMLQMANKTLQHTIPIRGNENSSNAFFMPLGNSKIFKIPVSGKYQVVDVELPQSDNDRTAVIPICVKFPSEIKLTANGKCFDVPSCRNKSPYWERIIIPIPAKKQRLSIELSGNVGVKGAIGDVQIFQ